MPLEHVDVAIVGAGLSGIGAAHHLQQHCPGKTYAILEAREQSGGTWDLFRYPGIRSDSDMYTLGYSFRPWKEAKAIADGSSILEYVRDTAAESGIDQHIRYGHRVIGAQWSSDDARWTLEIAGDGERDAVARLSCSFLMICSGYYRYDAGYTPEFEGADRFTGRIVHPQQWSDDVDYAGKRVVVIGSGATAVTLVPAMADSAEHVTMLQRSPSYILSLPGEDVVANALRRMLPARLAYAIVRWKNVTLATLLFQASRRAPGVVKAIIRKGVQARLLAGYDIDTHFKPSYDPWDQRLCLVPDGDLFNAIRSGRASVATDQIDTFTETGIKLRSGAELPAEVIVTATGLNLLALGGITLTVDGRQIELPDTLSYKGMMLSGVPNMAMALGYTNASWTLKCDLTCEYVCRLLNHMDAHGHVRCTPENRDPTVQAEPFIDFSSSYVLRAIEQFPKQGSKAPGRLHQNYFRDRLALRRGALEDGAMEFSPVSSGLICADTGR
jgi:monooxygenase